MVKTLSCIRVNTVIKYFTFWYKLLTVDYANICILTTYWSHNSMVLGKGGQLKMLPSD